MDILIATLIVAAVGLFCAVMLVLAAKFFAVSEDETEKSIRECLPGANCGACGYAGCDGYAKALAEDKGKNRDQNGLFHALYSPFPVPKRRMAVWRSMSQTKAFMIRMA